MSRLTRRLRAVIDADHVGRFESLADAASACLPDVAESLLSKLATARLASSKQMHDVVTVGTTLAYRDDISGREQDVTLAWPAEADIAEAPFRC
jgi:regulator of nucleoside diphosphate kinase